MPRYLLFNKPFQVLTQFTDPNGRATLADFIDVPDVYSAGRLDFDSEGLLLLTDDGPLIHGMMNPKFKVPKTYLAQVEGDVTDTALNQLMSGIVLKDGKTQPASAKRVQEPDWLWPRHPSIRERKNIPTSWIELVLTEGKNRQVRRMTAATGFPTLRLIRTSLGELSIIGMTPGEYQEITSDRLIDNGINKPTKSRSKPPHRKNSKRTSNRSLQQTRARQKAKK